MKHLLSITLTAGLTLFTTPVLMAEGNDYTQKDAIEEAVVDVEQLNNKLDIYLKEKNLDRFKLNWKDEPPYIFCLLYTSPSPRDRTRSRMPSSA